MEFTEGASQAPATPLLGQKGSSRHENPDNTGFYISHGFEHMKHFYAGEGAPPLEAMWRKPRR